MITGDSDSVVQIWPCPPKTIALADVPAEGFKIQKYVIPAPEKDRFPPPDLAFLRSTVGRVAPWVSSAFLVPSLLDSDGLSWGGFYLGNSSIIISTYGGWLAPVSLAAALHHELYHAVETRISGTFGRYLYDYVSKNSSHYGDEYLDTPSEKMARLYESFCQFMEHGGRFIVDKNDFLLSFLWSVYTGRFALEVAEFDQQIAEDLRKKQRRAVVISRMKSILGGWKNA